MFLGHFGLAFASKRASGSAALGTSFLAAQFIDLLWPFFLIAGVEKVEVDPGNTAFTPLNFVSYPFSHSLAAVIVWALLFGIVYYFLRKKSRAAIILAVLVLSHWFLDLLTHRPDLPISFGDGRKYGLGLWNNPAATIIVELIIFGAGCLLYLRSTEPRNKWGNISFISLAVFFLLIYMMNAFGDPPPNANAIGYVGLAQWLFILWGYWCDRTRRSRRSLSPQTLRSSL
jgi:membrane-bound metal-dependent hydrolase YbcI (DUF457 family)